MHSNTNFDSSANQYDSDFTHTEIGKMQRDFVYDFLNRRIFTNKPLSVLEINCGTGEDALWLAKKGHSVLGSDASAKMIEVARQKSKAIINTSLHFEQAAFSDLKSKFSSQKFDLIFSNFGGLNCVDKTEFNQLMDDFYALLNPNGKLVLVIMGRKCGWERLYFLLKGNSKSAFRRMSQEAVPANIGNGIIQPTFYFSPSEIKSLAEQNFQHLNTKPIGLFIPPSYLEKFFSNKKMLLQFHFQIEKLFGQFSFLSNYADHYLIYFKKNKPNF